MLSSDIVFCLEDIEEFKKLIIEYTHFLNRNLDFQNIDDELEDLTLKYTPPHGYFLLAYVKDQPVGCVAYHRLNDKQCEMKRLFIKEKYRKKHIGRQLVKKIIQQASKDGYQEMVLDTIEPLKDALQLYKSIGFVEIDAYYDNPMDDVIYMKKPLL